MFRSIASSTALAAGILLAFSPSVMGKSATIGDQEITAEQMPVVELHCAALLSSDGASEAPIADGGDGRDNQATDETSDTHEEAANLSTEATAGDATGENSGAKTPGIVASTDIDLDTVTVEDCEAAGIGAP